MSADFVLSGKFVITPDLEKINAGNISKDISEKLGTISVDSVVGSSKINTTRLKENIEQNLDIEIHGNQLALVGGVEKLRGQIIKSMSNIGDNIEISINFKQIRDDLNSQLERIKDKGELEVSPAIKNADEVYKKMNTQLRGVLKSKGGITLDNWRVANEQQIVNKVESFLKGAGIGISVSGVEQGGIGGSLGGFAQASSETIRKEELVGTIRALFNKASESKLTEEEGQTFSKAVKRFEEEFGKLKVSTGLGQEVETTVDPQSLKRKSRQLGEDIRAAEGKGDIDVANKIREEKEKVDEALKQIPQSLTALLRGIRKSLKEAGLQNVIKAVNLGVTAQPSSVQTVSAQETAQPIGKPSGSTASSAGKISRFEADFGIKPLEKITQEIELQKKSIASAVESGLDPTKVSDLEKSYIEPLTEVKKRYESIRQSAREYLATLRNVERVKVGEQKLTSQNISFEDAESTLKDLVLGSRKYGKEAREAWYTAFSDEGASTEDRKKAVQTLEQIAGAELGERGAKQQKRLEKQEVSAVARKDKERAEFLRNINEEQTKGLGITKELVQLREQLINQEKERLRLEGKSEAEIGVQLEGSVRNRVGDLSGMTAKQQENRLKAVVALNKEQNQSLRIQREENSLLEKQKQIGQGLASVQELINAGRQSGLVGARRTAEVMDQLIERQRRLYYLDQESKGNLIKDEKGNIKQNVTAPSREQLVGQIDQKQLSTLLTSKTEQEFNRNLSSMQKKMRETEAVLDNTIGRHKAKQMEDDSIFRLIGRQIRRLSGWTIVAGVAFKVRQAFNALIRTTIEFERAIIDTTKVMDITASEIDKLRQSTKLFGQEYGASLKDVAQASAVYAQQGKSLNEVIDLTRSSLLLANVSTLNMKDSTEALTAVFEQFDVTASNSIKIVDAWNEVANKNAVTEADLAEAVKRAGAAAVGAGVSFEKFSGIVAALQARTRRGGKVIGTTLKTLFSRLNSDQAIDALNSVGVATFDLAGEFRRADDRIEDLSRKWDDLTSVQKNNLAYAIAGRRRYAQFLALMQGFDQALEAAADAQNSFGSASVENTKILDTLDKRLLQTQATWESLISNFAEGGLETTLKTSLSLVDGLGKALNKLPTELLFLLGGGAAVGASSKIFKFLGTEWLKFQPGTTQKDIDNLLNKKFISRFKNGIQSLGKHMNRFYAGATLMGKNIKDQTVSRFTGQKRGAFVAAPEQTKRIVAGATGASVAIIGKLIEDASRRGVGGRELSAEEARYDVGVNTGRALKFGGAATLGASIAGFSGKQAGAIGGAAAAAIVLKKLTERLFDFQVASRSTSEAIDIINDKVKSLTSAIGSLESISIEAFSDEKIDKQIGIFEDLSKEFPDLTSNANEFYEAVYSGGDAVSFLKERVKELKDEIGVKEVAAGQQTAAGIESRSSIFGSLKNFRLNPTADLLSNLGLDESNNIFRAATFDPFALIDRVTETDSDTAARTMLNRTRGTNSFTGRIAEIVAPTTSQDIESARRQLTEEGRSIAAPFVKAVQDSIDTSSIKTFEDQVDAIGNLESEYLKTLGELQEKMLSLQTEGAREQYRYAIEELKKEFNRGSAEIRSITTGINVKEFANTIKESNNTVAKTISMFKNLSETMENARSRTDSFNDAIGNNNYAKGLKSLADDIELSTQALNVDKSKLIGKSLLNSIQASMDIVNNISDIFVDSSGGVTGLSQRVAREFSQSGQGIGSNIGALFGVVIKSALGDSLRDLPSLFSGVDVQGDIIRSLEGATTVTSSTEIDKIRDAVSTIEELFDIDINAEQLRDLLDAGKTISDTEGKKFKDFIKQNQEFFNEVQEAEKKLFEKRKEYIEAAISGINSIGDALSAQMSTISAITKDRLNINQTEFEIRSRQGFERTSMEKTNLARKRLEDIRTNFSGDKDVTAMNELVNTYGDTIAALRKEFSEGGIDTTENKVILETERKKLDLEMKVQEAAIETKNIELDRIKAVGESLKAQQEEVIGAQRSLFTTSALDVTRAKLTLGTALRIAGRPEGEDGRFTREQVDRIWKSGAFSTVSSRQGLQSAAQLAPAFEDRQMANLVSKLQRDLFPGDKDVQSEINKNIQDERTLLKERKEIETRILNIRLKVLDQEARNAKNQEEMFTEVLPNLSNQVKELEKQIPDYTKMVKDLVSEQNVEELQFLRNEIKVRTKELLTPIELPGRGNYVSEESKTRVEKIENAMGMFLDAIEDPESVFKNKIINMNTEFDIDKFVKALVKYSADSRVDPEEQKALLDIIENEAEK